MRHEGHGVTECACGFSLPSLTLGAEVAVNLIRNSRDPEECLFLFGLEEVAGRPKRGVFVRPAKRMSAGRDHFSRSDFTRQFRMVFVSETDRMRRDPARMKGRRGWLGFKYGLGGAVDLPGSLASSLLRFVALSVGNQLPGQLAAPGFLKGKSAEAKPADGMGRAKEPVEAALRKIGLPMHPARNKPAHRDGLKDRNTGLDRNARPLPDDVRSHLDQDQSGS